MKITTAIALTQLFLIATGNEIPGERKRVACTYMGLQMGKYSNLFPEDLDASICTHLTFIHGAINREAEEIQLKELDPELKTGGEGFVPRLAKLKEVNPNLKLLLHLFDPPYTWISQKSSRRSNIIQSGVKWLNESGFDGFELPVYSLPAEKAEIADFFCEMKSELDKYGYTLTAVFMENSFPGTPEENREVVSKMARCSDHILLRTSSSSLEDVTHRIAPMSLIESNVDNYIEKGLPAKKALIIIPAIGLMVTLEDLANTGLGANFSGPGWEDPEGGPGTHFRLQQLLRKMNDSSLGWTYRRDNVTKEPYAFSTTGLWISYEDATSMEFKARYVMEKGLGGLSINIMEAEDVGNFGDEGRFPLTRAAHNFFNQILPTESTSS